MVYNLLMGDQPCGHIQETVFHFTCLQKRHVPGPVRAVHRCSGRLRPAGGALRRPWSRGGGSEVPAASQVGMLTPD